MVLYGVTFMSRLSMMKVASLVKVSTLATTSKRCAQNGADAHKGFTWESKK